MSKLYIVPTPIGNLEDITIRAIHILEEVDVILAEDTRRTKILLSHYNIQKPLLSHHRFNEKTFISKIINRLMNGESIALVSDAGTPVISDPGYALIKACIGQQIAVECLPGATALIPALVISGLTSDSFCFEGFLPHKKGRQKKIKLLADEKRTIILYESPHRILKTLNELMTIFNNDRKASISRELTKIHEETIRGSLKELYDYYQGKNIKGEIVLIVEGNH